MAPAELSSLGQRAGAAHAGFNDQFGGRVLDFETTSPQIYVQEVGTAIFSLLKKEYDAPAARARSAMARFKAMPKLFEQAKVN